MQQDTYIPLGASGGWRHLSAGDYLPSSKLDKQTAMMQLLVQLA